MHGDGVTSTIEPAITIYGPEATLELKDSPECCPKDELSNALPSSATEWRYFTITVRGIVQNTLQGTSNVHIRRLLKCRNFFGIVYSFFIVMSSLVSGVDREIIRLSSGRTYIIHWSICTDAHSYIAG